jgi:CRP/FNR family transcriptional regulator, anaerobic regulatory protein
VGFALPGRHSCSVESVYNDVAARQFSTQAFLSHLHAHPSSMYRMLEITLKRINAAYGHMLLLGRMTAEERLVEFIIDWRARLGRRRALAHLVFLLSRGDIADYLGLAIETVSRVLGKLEKVVLVVGATSSLPRTRESMPITHRSRYSVGAVHPRCPRSRHGTSLRLS